MRRSGKTSLKYCHVKDEKEPVYEALGAERYKRRVQQGQQLVCLKKRKGKAHVSELRYLGCGSEGRKKRRRGRVISGKGIHQLYNVGTATSIKSNRVSSRGGEYQ